MKLGKEDWRMNDRKVDREQPIRIMPRCSATYMRCGYGADAGGVRWRVWGRVRACESRRAGKRILCSVYLYSVERRPGVIS